MRSELSPTRGTTAAMSYWSADLPLQADAPGQVMLCPATRPDPLAGGQQHGERFLALLAAQVQLRGPAASRATQRVVGGVAAEPGGVGQQRREPLDPAKDRDVVDFDTAFDQQLLHVAVGQAVAQLPAHRHHDHLGREPEAREGGARRQR